MRSHSDGVRSDVYRIPMLIGESESLYNCKMHDLSSFSQRYHFLNRLLGPGLMQGRPGVPFPTGTTWISRGSAVVLQIPSGPTAMYGVTPSNGFTVRTSSPPGVLWIVPSLPG